MKIGTISNLLQLWYGDPVTGKELERLNTFSTNYINRHGQRGSFHFMGTMQEMMVNWWKDENQNAFPMHSIHYAGTKRKLALYHLIAGQLLMSCKLEPAMDYLDMGLRHADGLVSSEHYFTIYNRHEELRHLKLSHERQTPRTLVELLNESRVMRKLAPHSRYSIPRKR